MNRIISFFVIAFGVACTTVLHGQTDEQRSFPIVVRLSERMFHSPEPEVDDTTRLDLVTLGGRSRGLAVTHGQLRPDFVNSYDKAAFGLVFEGTSTAQTMGRRGPAILRTTTVSTFRQSVPVSFDINSGFAAGAVRGSVQIESIRHRVSSTAPGLRGVLVRRIAQGRLRDLAGQIRAIAHQNTQSRIAGSMDRRVKAKLSALNQQWFRWREALAERTADSPRLSFATEDSHLLIFISRGEPAQSFSQEALPVKSLPPAHADAEVELLIQLGVLDILRDETLSLLNLLTTVEQPLVLFGESAASAFQTEQQGPWSVFRLRFATANERTILPGSEHRGPIGVHR